MNLNTNRILFFFPFLILFSCNQISEETRFQSLTERYTEARYLQFPDWASSVNHHEYDHILVIPSETKLADDLLFCQQYLDSLSAIKKDQLSLESQESLLDHQEQLQAIIQQISKKNNFNSDATFYNVQGPFRYLLQSQHAPLKKRLFTINKKMQSIPSYYRTAKRNLTRPKQETIDQAIEEHLNTFAFFQQTMRDSLFSAKLDQTDRKKFLRNLNKSQDAIKDYVAFCNSIQFEFANQNRNASE